MAKATAAAATRIRPTTINNDWYHDLGVEGWWDPDGPVAVLHEINPVRAAYVLDLIRAHAPAGRAPLVLDLGCGGGILAEALAAGGCRVVGLDPSFASLVAARHHGLSTGLDGPPNYMRAVGEALPFDEATFDGVVASESMEHVEDAPAVLREVRRVLMPSGVFCFDTPHRNWFNRIGLLWAAELLGWAPRGTHEYSRLFTPTEFAARCVEVGLRVEELRGLAMLKPPWSAAFNYMTRRRLGGFEIGDDDRLSFIGYAHAIPPVAATTSVE